MSWAEIIEDVVLVFLAVGVLLAIAIAMSCGKKED